MFVEGFVCVKNMWNDLRRSFTVSIEGVSKGRF